LKKIILLAAMLAMVLAAAVPTMAQKGDGNIDSLIALGVGILLVAGGLLARKIVR